MALVGGLLFQIERQLHPWLFFVVSSRSQRKTSGSGAKMRMQIDPKSGYCKSNGTYYSKRDPVTLPPPEDYFDLPTYIFSHLRKQGAADSIALTDGLTTGNEISYTELRNKVRSVAAGLQSSLGIKKGDVVLILSPNSVHIPVIALGIMSIGAIVTAMNPLSTPTEIQKQAVDSNAVLVFTVQPLVAKITLTLPLVLIESKSNNNDDNGIRKFYTLEQLFASDASQLVPVKIKQQDTATLLYSSGTVGKSKGVVLTHRNFIAIASNYLQRFNHTGSQGCPYTFLCIPPMFHVYGFNTGVNMLITGATLVVLPKFEMQALLSTVQRCRVTHLSLPPPVLLGLTKSPLVAASDLGTVKEIGTGGAPVRKEVIEGFIARFPWIQVLQIYGLTESSGALSYANCTEEGKKRYGTVGLLAPNVEAKVVDILSGDLLPPNHQGELWVRSPTVMQGYHGDLEATLSCLDSEGWLRTGDLCFFDDEGYLFIVDRLKDMIKYKSFQVVPAELEFLLLSNPEIHDVAVIPYPDEKAGQVPMAFVVRKPNSKVSADDVINSIAKQVAPYKKIRQVAFVNSIPKSISGKILRKELIQLSTFTSRL